jgi:hypothetical protein
MCRAERRAKERKAAEFVARMKIAKISKRLVVKRNVQLPDAAALALVAKWKQKQAMRPSR